jgi:hypothetical protein
MLLVKDLKIFFSLLCMEQVSGQLWIVAATFILDMFDDQLRIIFH